MSRQLACFLQLSQTHLMRVLVFLAVRALSASPALGTDCQARGSSAPVQLRAASGPTAMGMMWPELCLTILGMSDPVYPHQT